MLRQTTYRDIRTTIFGETYDSPLLVSPVGVQTIFHEDRELGVAGIRRRVGRAVYHEYGSLIVDRRCVAGERGWPEVVPAVLVAGGRDNAIGEPVPTAALHLDYPPPSLLNTANLEMWRVG